MNSPAGKPVVLRPITLISRNPALLMAFLAALMVLYRPTAVQARNLSIVSGNMIDVDGMRIRLWGIRVPEADVTCHRGNVNESCAAFSRRVLERLIGSEELRCLVKVSHPSQPVGAQCSVQGADLGHLMVLGGWATDDGAESGGFYAVQEEVAREQRVGMWKDH